MSKKITKYTFLDKAVHQINFLWLLIRKRVLNLVFGVFIGIYL